MDVSWTIKKAECQRTDIFELWCWRRLLQVPWTARSNQSILKDISPEYSLEGLMLKLKEESEKAGLKLNIQKTQIMVSGPIVSWQIDGETMEAVTDFIFLGCKITTDGDCSHEIKRRLLLGRKVMTNLDNILKSRDITLPTKVHLVKTMAFPVAVFECERWTIKKAEQ